MSRVTYGNGAFPRGIKTAVVKAHAVVLLRAIAFSREDERHGAEAESRAAEFSDR